MNAIDTNYNNFGTNGYENVSGTSGAGNVGRTEENASVTDETALRFQEARKKVASEAGLPDIEAANLTSAEEMERNIDSVGKKLTSAQMDFRGKKVMFDIYALLDLVQEMSQKMRNAMREVRQLENQTIQMNIVQQAKVQRRAAVCGAIAGAVVCAVQVGATAVVSGLTMKQMSSQSQMQAKTGVDVYSKVDDIAGAASNRQLAAQQLENIRAEDQALFGETQMTHLTQAENVQTAQVAEAKAELDVTQAKMNEAVQKGAEKQTAVNTAEQKVAQAEQKVALAKQKVTDADAAVKNEQEMVDAYSKAVGGEKAGGEKATVQERIEAANFREEAKSSLAARQNEAVTARQDLAREENALANAKQELANAKQELNATTKEIEDLQVELPEKTRAWTDAKSDNSPLAKAMQKDVDAYAEEFQAQRSRANMELEANGSISDDTQAALDKAAKQLKIATAKQADMIARFRADGTIPIEDAAAARTAASARFSKAQARGMNAADQLKGQAAITKLQMWQTISMSLGQYGQQLSGSLQQIISANATELQAEQKMTEDQLDQIKDLFSQQQSVIQKVFEIFASIVAKESQTIEGIIRA